MSNHQSFLPFSIVNVFSSIALGLRGNPSSVILMREAIDERLMQIIGKDLHQPATTFLWPAENENTYHVRWFAPDAQIQLCGHGALAAIAFLSNQGLIKDLKTAIILKANGRHIIGKKISDDYFSIQLEAIKSEKVEAIPKLLEKALCQQIIEYRSSENKNIVVLENELAVANMKPNFNVLRNIDVFGYAVTAPSNKAKTNVDFVSRTLVPHVQQQEDHATGSSHALLVPYWSEKLKIKDLSAKQLSPRGGFFKTHYENNFVTLIGESYNSVEGTFMIQNQVNNIKFF